MRTNLATVQSEVEELVTKIGQTDIANNAREVSGLASNRKLTLKRDIAEEMQQIEEKENRKIKNMAE